MYGWVIAVFMISPPRLTSFLTHLPSSQIMTAVQQSSQLDISGSDSVLRATKNNFYEIQTLSVADIMSTKVRAIENPTYWVLQINEPPPAA